MPRNRQGSIWYEKKIDPKTGKSKVIATYGRVTFTDEHGKRRDRKRKALSGTVTEARGHIKDLFKELDDQGERSIDGARMTFTELADYYKEEYAVEAEYDNKGEKIAGLRSWRDVRRKLVHLSGYFGSKRIREINYSDLLRLKRNLLKTPVTVKHKITTNEDGKRVVRWEAVTRPRALATVDRDLALLRRMFSVAVQERWLVRNPFKDGDALIDISKESMRERIATPEEEKALLAECVEPREHLRPFLLCAFDTGMRAGEIFRLKKTDLNFETEQIKAISYKGKKRRERLLRMTPRLKRALLKQCANDPESLKVFEMLGVKRSFATAKRLAKLKGVDLDGFRLHDIRHTTTTRLIKGNMPVGEAGKLMGHTQAQTTWRYNNPDSESQDRAADILSAYHDDED
jgi:integrase